MKNTTLNTSEIENSSILQDQENINSAISNLYNISKDLGASVEIFQGIISEQLKIELNNSVINELLKAHGKKTKIAPKEMNEISLNLVTFCDQKIKEFRESFKTMKKGVTSSTAETLKNERIEEFALKTLNKIVSKSSKFARVVLRALKILVKQETFVKDYYNSDNDLYKTLSYYFDMDNQNFLQNDHTNEMKEFARFALRPKAYEKLYGNDYTRLNSLIHKVVNGVESDEWLNSKIKKDEKENERLMNEILQNNKSTVDYDAIKKGLAIIANNGMHLMKNGFINSIADSLNRLNSLIKDEKKQEKRKQEIFDEIQNQKELEKLTQYGNRLTETEVENMKSA